MSQPTEGSRTWVHAAATFAERAGLPRDAVEALRVYDRGGDTPWEGSFDELERTLLPTATRLDRQIREELSTDVDAHQAGLFADRYRSLDALLARDPSTAARLLRVGLLQRVTQVLAEGGPTRALRVRGVVDYLYSRAALVWHARSEHATPTIREFASQATYRTVQPGVAFARLQGTTAWGPQHVCVLKVAPGAADLHVLDAWTGWGADADVARHVSEAGAIAAFSGGFFLYSEPDIEPPCARHDPVGLLMSEGRVLAPAVFARSALVQTDAGNYDVRTIGLGDHQIRIGSGPWGRPTEWTNRARGTVATGIAVVGDRVVASGRDVEVPLNGVVVSAIDGTPVPHVRTGESVQWRLPGVSAGISGGPVLLRGGEVGSDLVAEDFAGTAPPRTFVDDETGDQNLLPRLAVGVMVDGALLVAAVDGRSAEWALGLRLHSLGELMHALGAVRAMNLDGGSSKRMIVDGSIVDRPSVGVQGPGVTVSEVRPLHTAVLVHLRR